MDEEGMRISEKENEKVNEDGKNTQIQEEEEEKKSPSVNSKWQ